MLTCKITNPNKRHLRDLEQGSLEILCLVIFQGKQELLDTVKSYILLLENVVNSCSNDRSCTLKIKQEPGEETDNRADNIVFYTPEVKQVKVELVGELNYNST